MTFMKGLPLLLLVASLCSHAALQPDRTRIVFNANDKATSLRVDNRSDKLPTSLIPRSKMKRGEKRRSSGRPATDTTSGTESNNAGADSQASVDREITGRSRNAIFYNIREVPPPGKKQRPCRFASRHPESYQGVLETGCITQESRRKGRTAVTGQPAG